VLRQFSSVEGDYGGFSEAPGVAAGTTVDARLEVLATEPSGTDKQRALPAELPSAQNWTTAMMEIVEYLIVH
jgi:hypothetical protein